MTLQGLHSYGLALAIASIGLFLGNEAVRADSFPEPLPLGQAESPQLVLPFTDVPSDHWAYQALLNLAGTYGCLSGYPDGTFRGEATVTRYEFSAGMDACMGVLTGLMEQRQGEDRQAIEALIESMQQSLNELRQVGGESPDSP